MDGRGPAEALASPAPLDSSTHHQSLVGGTNEPADFQQRRSSAELPVDALAPSLLEESTIRLRPPAPTLTPFYTIISDVTPSSSASDTYYPRVRYVFSDDDLDIISGALSTPPASQSRPVEPRHGPPSPAHRIGSGLHGRSILLDLAPAADGRGYTVAWASSLSPDWAVVGTRLQPLESVSASGVTDDDDGRTIVLNIEGLGLPIAAASSSDPSDYPRTSVTQDGRKVSSLRTDKAAPKVKDYGDLVRTFEMRMASLRSAVYNSEERRRLASMTGPKLPEEK
ncbi:hypothetical protein F503_06222 [Ophiostoma piceae UAMH 11346]|uniref:Uncharacterized protein n=1 Tax=Ophiostoma piceae (strain UAMH 11346) TaxID=1262450 RepID=S3CEA4_OPHP1|nr:hypothetical protein F503_06222 [Ophiostoma piceae UAMH 11346]